MMFKRNVILSTLVVFMGSVASAESYTWDNFFGFDNYSATKPVAKRSVGAGRKVKAQSMSKKAVVAKRIEPKPKRVVTKESVASEISKPAKVDQQPARIGKVEVSTEALDVRLSRFKHVDPKNEIGEEPLKRALAFYATNQHKVSNSRYLAVIDFSKNSAKPRFCIINMNSGDTECMKTSHGIGSDGGGGWAKKFSNRKNSHASSVGYYKTLSTYSGKHGTSLRLDGLSATNSNALDRAIVIHPAAYVTDRTRAVSGRSQGCPALDKAKAQRMIAQLKGGAIIYAWHPQHMSEPSQ